MRIAFVLPVKYVVVDVCYLRETHLALLSRFVVGIDICTPQYSLAGAAEAAVLLHTTVEWDGLHLTCLYFIVFIAAAGGKIIPNEMELYTHIEYIFHVMK